jgi:hypothetical protein
LRTGAALPEEWVRVADGVVTLRPDPTGERRAELALVRLLRVLAEADDPVTIVLGEEQAGGTFDPADLAELCRLVRCGIDLRVRRGRELVVPMPQRGLFPVAARPPSELLAGVAGEVFEGLPVEWAAYADAVAAEHLGVPIVGERDGELVVGIDPRDQAMAREAGVGVAEQARRLLSLVRASRAGQRTRVDLSRFALGRWLRSSILREDLVPFEIGPLGRGPDRAFAHAGDVLFAFASGANPLVVLEAALLLARASQWTSVTFVLEGSPHPLLVELGRLLGMHARFESRSLLDGPR